MSVLRTGGLWTTKHCLNQSHTLERQETGPNKLEIHSQLIQAKTLNRYHNFPQGTESHKLPSLPLTSFYIPQSAYIAFAEFPANHAANAPGFLVCINTVPGPVNLHTSPSPAAILAMIPPEDTRSRTYLQFQATRWPLSMMYFSLGWS